MLNKRHYDWNHNFTFTNYEKKTEFFVDTYSENILNMKEAQEYLGVGRKSILNLIEEEMVTPIIVKSNPSSSRFSYYFNIEDLAIAKILMIIKK